MVQGRFSLLRRTLFTAAAVVSAFFVISADAQSAAQGPRFTPARPWDMEHIRLAMNVDVEKKRVDAIANLRLAAIGAQSSITLDAVDFEVSKITVKTGGETSRECAFSNSGDRLEIYLPERVADGGLAEIEVSYVLRDPKSGLHFFAPDEDDPKAPFQVWSQGQSTSNRHWVPCFDHPGEMQTTEILATVDDRFVVLSNGRQASTPKRDGSGKTTYHWIQDKPHVAYLMTLVIGEFEIVEEKWRDVPVSYYVPRDRVGDVERTFGRTVAMLDFFSEKIGVPYPWSKYAQVCCYNFGGGMENTSATTLGEGALLDERSVMDGDSDGLIAHELAHQWFGDLLTCREWAHLWMNEGFASYFEALWAEHHRGADDFSVNMMRKAQNAIRGGKDRPVVDRTYGAAGEMFDSRAYPKGAWVLHMLRRRVGDETFWRALNRYVSENRHRTVETADLRRAFENVTGQSFERFFYDWTERAGHPVLDVRLVWRESEKTAEITVEQTQKDEAFHIPLLIELRTEGGEQAVLHRELSEKLAVFIVPLPAAPTMMRVDPEQAVLMELKETKSRDLWLAQLREDPAAAARIRAAQRLAENKSDANREALSEALPAERHWGVRGEIAEKLGELGGDAARDALLAGAKDAEPRVRRACVAALAKFKGDERATTVVREMLASGDASVRVEAETIRTYASLAADDAFEAILPAIDRASPREQIQAAAVEAMGELTDPRVIEILIRSTGKGRPANVRQSAVRALARAAAAIRLDDASRNQAVDALVVCLETKARRLRSAAAGALGEMGRHAESAAPVLRQLAASAPDDRFRRAIRTALDRIEKDRPSDAQIADLRDKLKRIETENDALTKRLTELEADQAAIKRLIQERPSTATESAPPPRSAAQGGPATSDATAGKGSSDR